MHLSVGRLFHLDKTLLSWLGSAGKTLLRSDSGGEVLLVIGSTLRTQLIVKQYDVDMDCLEVFRQLALKVVNIERISARISGVMFLLFVATIRRGASQYHATCVAKKGNGQYMWSCEGSHTLFYRSTKSAEI